MARKPAKMYRQVKGQSFTRRKYTGGVPNNRILRFHMGNRTRAEAGRIPSSLTLNRKQCLPNQTHCPRSSKNDF